MPTIQTYSVAGGFGYFIEWPEAGVRIRQDFAPGFPGFTAMSEAEAQHYAEQDVAALQAAYAGQGEGGEPATTEP